MASFVYRPGKSRRGTWQAKIKRVGWPQQTGTFDTRVQAEAWARQIEGEMDRGIFQSRAEAEQTTLADALRPLPPRGVTGKTQPAPSRDIDPPDER